tara:strand:+ start:179 stop:313 length:135 start_codon:yes stop_codon:yes gene_type:complete
MFYVKFAFRNTYPKAEGGPNSADFVFYGKPNVFIIVAINQTLKN